MKSTIEKTVEQEFAAAKAWGTTSGYGLKNLKIFIAGSEETICFQADVTKDGVVVGHASNRGHGDSTFVDVRRVSIPEIAEIQDRLELYIDGLVGEEVDKKEKDRAMAGAKRSLKRKGCFLMAYKWTKDSQSEDILSYIGWGGTKEGFEANLAKNGREGYCIVSI